MKEGYCTSQARYSTFFVLQNLKNLYKNLTLCLKERFRRFILLMPLSMTLFGLKTVMWLISSFQRYWRSKSVSNLYWTGNDNQIFVFAPQNVILRGIRFAFIRLDLWMCEPLFFIYKSNDNIKTGYIQDPARLPL